MVRFVQIAMGSGAEPSYHFLLARDLSLMQAAEYDVVDADIGEIMRLLSALSGKLREPAEPRHFELGAKG